VPLDAAVELAAVLMFREEGLEIVEQISIPLVAYSATLTGRRGHVNVSDCRHYFPFGSRGYESLAAFSGEESAPIGA